VVRPEDVGVSSSALVALATLCNWVIHCKCSSSTSRGGRVLCLIGPRGPCIASDVTCVKQCAECLMGMIMWKCMRCQQHQLVRSKPLRPLTPWLIDVVVGGRRVGLQVAQTRLRAAGSSSSSRTPGHSHTIITQAVVGGGR
jgi:hypothetical protein